MFGFLKDKLKKAVKAFSSKAKEDVIEEKADEKEIKAAIAKEQKRKRRATEIEDTPKAKAHREKHKDDVKVVTKPKVVSKPVEKKEVVDAEPEVVEETKEPIIEKEVFIDEPAVEEVVEETKEVEPEVKEEVVDAEPEVVEDEPVVEEKEEVVEETPVVEEEPVVEEVVPEVKKPSLFKRFLGKKKEEEPVVEEVVEEEVVEKEPVVEETVQEEVSSDTEDDGTLVTEESAGFFDKIKDSFTKKHLTEEKFEELFWNLEMSLLENNVAVEVIEKIKADMKKDLTTGKVTRKGIEQLIVDSLKDSLESLFLDPYDLVKKVKAAQKPYIISFIGVNGAGKTTTLAKVANLFQENGLSVVISASDTFRAAAIDQLKEHTDNLGIKLISQGYGADPAAVAFDAVEHAKAKNIDVVMIDTAGRLHSNTNLMAELEKVIRVAKPNLKIFIGECITGNDCVEQASKFDEVVGIDAIILSKADVDEKGGAAISVSHVTGHPILYLGTGQAYGDLQPFDKERIIKNLGL